MSGVVNFEHRAMLNVVLLLFPLNASLTTLSHSVAHTPIEIAHGHITTPNTRTLSRSLSQQQKPCKDKNIARPPISQPLGRMLLDRHPRRHRYRGERRGGHLHLQGARDDIPRGEATTTQRRQLPHRARIRSWLHRRLVGVRLVGARREKRGAAPSLALPQEIAANGDDKADDDATENEG